MIQPKILKHGESHPAIRDTLAGLADAYGITPDEVVAISLNGEVGRAITITPTLFVPARVEPELLRERASRLLSTANRLEQERQSAPAQTPRFDLQREVRLGDPSAVPGPSHSGGVTGAEQA